MLISPSFLCFDRKMNIPAYTSPTLCIGRTFDAENSTACSDVFPSGIPTKRINVNKFSFKYTVVKNSKDVNDLLDVSGELSLKIKANLLRVEGAGQYINDVKKEAGTTTLLAVMKCTTVRLATCLHCRLSGLEGLDISLRARFYKNCQNLLSLAKEHVQLEETVGLMSAA